MHRAQLTFQLRDIGAAKAVQGALALEAGEGPEGSRAQVRQDGVTLHIDLEAATVSDLRAAMNSIVRLLDAATRTVSPA